MGALTDQASIAEKKSFLFGEDQPLDPPTKSNTASSRVIRHIVGLARQCIECEIALLDITATYSATSGQPASKEKEASKSPIRLKSHTTALNAADIDKTDWSDPLLAQQAGMHFIASLPLLDAAEEKIGTLTLADRRTRKLKGHQYTCLKTLAKMAAQLIEKSPTLSLA